MIGWLGVIITLDMVEILCDHLISVALNRPFNLLPNIPSGLLNATLTFVPTSYITASNGIYGNVPVTLFFYKLLFHVRLLLLLLF